MPEEGGSMKVMSTMKHMLVGVFAAVIVPACALEVGDPASEEAQGEPAVQGAQTDTQADDAGADATAAETANADSVIPFATPTCNGVRNWFNAAVPDVTSSGTVDCNMVRGDVSGAVAQLQRSMNVCYHEHLVTDGSFGRLTFEALVRTQTTAGTPHDGQYGPNTRKAMRHESNDVPGTCTRVP
jgi:hypothetical protein